MSKKLFIGLLGLSFIIAFSCFSPANAAFDLQKALLFPGNPLYFIKEFSRNVQRILTVDATSKAELELGIADSLASEVLAVEEKDPAGLRSALLKYSEDLDLLKNRVSDIKPGTDEQNVGRFLGSLAERSLAHDRLIGGVVVGHPELEADATDARKKLVGIVSLAEKNIGKGYESSDARMGVVASSISSPSDGIAMLDFLARLEDEFDGSFGDVREVVVSKISGMSRSDSSTLAAVLNDVSAIYPADQKAKVIVDIAERIPDSALAARLRSMEGDISSGISEAAAAAEISRARRAASALSGMAAAFSSSDIMPRIDKLIEDADGLRSKGDHAAAFLSARSAEVIAVRYSADLSVTKEQLSVKAAKFSSEYDGLVSLAGEKGFTAENSPVLWGRLGDLKKLIGNIVDTDSVREAEKLVSEIRSLIDKPVSDAPAVTTPVFCPTLYDPVCGKDEKTYANSCIARSVGVEIAAKGECAKKDQKPPVSEGVICPMVYSPVCGDDGVTYANSCIAGSAGAKVKSVGACPASGKTDRFPTL